MTVEANPVGVEAGSSDPDEAPTKVTEWQGLCSARNKSTIQTMM